MKYGLPYPARSKRLADLQKTQASETHSLRFQGSYQPFPVYRISIDVPKYRLENGRTGAAQEEYIANTKGVSEDFFTKDPESDAAQKVQHELLKEMIDQSGLHKYFARNEQEDPIVLSAEGFVVNGNRRLCSIREHYHSDQEKFRRYRNIRVIVLPKADDKELDWLEGKEQIQEDITAEYSWTAEAIMYRRRMKQHGFTEPELASLYEKKSSQIKKYLQMLEHAEIYLMETGHPGQYHYANDRYAFSQLVKYRGRIKGVENRDIFDHLCYSVFEQPIGDRVYQTVADIFNYFERINRTLVDELVSTRPKHKKVVGKNENGDKAKLLGKKKILKPDVLDIVSDKKNRGKVREVLRDAIDSEKQEARETKDKMYVVNQVRSAQKTLQRAVDEILQKSTQSSRDGLAEALKEIEKQLSALRKWLNAKSKN